jgi:FixJ family two-component response regulator
MEQSQKHIALVDDEKEIVETLRRQLEHFGFKCSSFFNANSALEAILSDNTLDILITDVRMPGMSGLELVKCVREVNSEIPIVILTGFGDMQLTLDALRSGATDYLSKPYDVMILKKSIDRIIKQKFRSLKYLETIKYLTKSNIHYSVKSEDVDVVSISSHIADFLHGLGYYNLTEKLNFGLALTEALINSNDHGNLELNSSLKESEFEGEDEYTKFKMERLSIPKYAERTLEIDLVVSSEDAVIKITDEGNGFETSEHTEVDPLDAFINENNHGRGIILMQLYVDKISYNDKGNEITLIIKKQV